LVERQPSKLDVAGSNPVSRSTPPRPAAFCFGRAHVVMHGNEALIHRFGACVGLPAREGLVGLPANAFSVMDAVLDRGRPLATWIRFDDEEWRLTVAPRIDPENAETYGVTIYLRARSDPAGKATDPPRQSSPG
jgi:hypothetical protein